MKIITISLYGGVLSIAANGWCYAFGFACRNYQVTEKVNAKLTYSTC
jgi:hypothetical protein